MLITALQNGTLFNPNPQSITVYLTNISRSIVIQKNEISGVYRRTDLEFPLNLGHLPDNRKWKLTVNLKYTSFSVNSSFINFSKHKMTKVKCYA